MATANLTWTNNSTDATSTKIERTEQVNFDHSSASPSELANSSAGGLDPDSATGSYTDTSLAKDRNYAYRVSTVKNSDVATSIQSPMEYVYDIDIELGYANGSPAVAQNYNISEQPAIHYDSSRIGGFETVDLTDPYTDPGVVTDFMDTPQFSCIRSNTTGVDISARPHSIASASGLIKDSRGRRFQGTGQQQVSTGHQLSPVSDIAFPDEVTIFHAVHARFNDQATLPKFDNTFGVTNSTGLNGVSYYGGTISSTNALVMGVYSSYIQPILTYWQFWCVRILNTLDAFNGSGVKAQVFYNGNTLLTTDSLNDVSYHSGNTLWSKNLGAFSIGSSPLRLPYISNAAYASGTGESLVFDKALDINDMNTVFAYLGNKYGQSVGTISSVYTG